MFDGEATGSLASLTRSKKSTDSITGVNPHPTSNQFVCTASGADKIYETALDIGVNKFNMNMVTHFETLGALHEAAFGRRPEEPHPGAFGRGAGDDGVELLSDFSGEQQRGSRLVDLALNLGGGIFLIGAVLGEICQFGDGVGQRRTGQRGF